MGAAMTDKWRKGWARQVALKPIVCGAREYHDDDTRVARAKWGDAVGYHVASLPEPANVTRALANLLAEHSGTDSLREMRDVFDEELRRREAEGDE